MLEANPVVPGPRDSLVTALDVSQLPGGVVLSGANRAYDLRGIWLGVAFGGQRHWQWSPAHWRELGYGVTQGATDTLRADALLGLADSVRVGPQAQPTGTRLLRFPLSVGQAWADTLHDRWAFDVRWGLSQLDTAWHPLIYQRQTHYSHQVLGHGPLQLPDTLYPLAFLVHRALVGTDSLLRPDGPPVDTLWADLLGLRPTDSYQAHWYDWYVPGVAQHVLRITRYWDADSLLLGAGVFWGPPTGVQPDSVPDSIPDSRAAVTPQIGLQLYPNPASDQLSWHGAQPGSQLRLTDALGRTVWAGYAPPQGTLAVGQLPRGLYSLTVSSQQGTQHTQKIWLR
jgi:hypothetical protein